MIIGSELLWAQNDCTGPSKPGRLVLKWKIAQNYKTSSSSLKFIDIYNIIIELNTRDSIYPVSNELREIFSILIVLSI